MKKEAAAFMKAIASSICSGMSAVTMLFTSHCLFLQHRF